MTENNNGGPAFPVKKIAFLNYKKTSGIGPTEPDEIIGEPVYECSEGMSLRDYFAAKAMQGIISTMKDWDLLSHGDFSPEEDTPPSEISITAYKIADAMLKEREK